KKAIKRIVKQNLSKRRFHSFICYSQTEILEKKSRHLPGLLKLNFTKNTILNKVLIFPYIHFDLTCPSFDLPPQASYHLRNPHPAINFLDRVPQIAILWWFLTGGS